MKALKCQVQNKISHPNWSLCALYRISNTIDFNLEAEELLERLLDAVMGIANVEEGLLFLVVRDGGDLELVAARGMDNGAAKQAREFGRQLATGAVESTGPVVSLAAKSNDSSALRRVEEGEWFEPPLGIPLRIRGQFIGLLYLNRPLTSGTFPRTHMPFYQALADQVALVVDNSRHYARLRRENARLRRQVESGYRFANILGESRPMRRMKALLEKVVQSPVPVLIVGESGTGKEVIARAIHGEGPRREEAFVAENCAALPEALLESELFGHARGAFTGADQEKPGLFEVADGGVLFLDEIADTTSAVQAKLLRALETGEIRRLGETQPRQVDARVVAATSRDLLTEVEAGRFRAELYYRLSVLTVELPPLRQRMEDIPVLAVHFLDNYARRTGKDLPGFSAEVMEVLQRYDWPGNVRQLRNEVERMAALADGGVQIGFELVSDTLRGVQVEPAAALEGESLPQALQRIKKTIIVDVLAGCEGNRTRAAAQLGISRPNLQKTMRRLVIK